MGFSKLSLVAFSALFIQNTFARIELVQSLAPLYGKIEEYQLGSEWGKKRVTDKNLQTQSKAFIRAASATVFMPEGATGFYIGKFAGAHVIATNHHVCPTAEDCLNDRVNFRILNRKYKVIKFYTSQPNVDLALMQIEVPKEDEALLKPVAKNFAFDRAPTKGQELLTIGFGVGGNPNNFMMANQDSDCKIFSKTNEVRHMGDPDLMNPEQYQSWSFAHGCDISHGDSGSAMVDRKNGDVLGIVWTGRMPKIKAVQDSAFLQQLFLKPTEFIWTEMNYGVPSTKVGEYLERMSQQAKYDEETKKVFKAILKG